MVMAVRRHTRVNYRMMRSLADESEANAIRVNGLQATRSRGGTAIAPLSPLPHYVFIVALVEGAAICKPVWGGDGMWRVPDTDAHNIKAKFPPNHNESHYEYHVLTTPQPDQKALACTLERDSEGNIIVIPGYRFKLVEPPDPATCAECV
jgi:hypothetical protein